MNTSVNQDWDWRAALKLLGTNAANVSPFSLLCPLCGGLSHVLAAASESEQWIFCEQCKFKGSVFQLLMASWDLDVAECVARLREHKIAVPDSWSTFGGIEQLQLTIAENSRQWWRWKGFRAELKNSTLKPGASAIFSRLSLDVKLTHNSDGVWSRRFGRLIGLTGHSQLRRMFDRSIKAQLIVSPPPEEFLRSEQLPDGRRHKSFRGYKPMEQVLVLPSSFMPGKISGFHAVFGYGNLDQRAFFPVDKANSEGGLLWLDVVLSAGSRHVVAVEDPWFAARLQSHHLNVMKRPLPLTAWVDTPKYQTRKAWQSLSRRKIVLWSPKPTWRVFRQAILSGGKIAFDASLLPSDRAELLSRQPDVLLAAVVAKAVAWPIAAAKYVQNLTPDEQFRLAMQLQQDQTLGSEFLLALPSKLSNALLGRLTKERNYTMISFGGRNYVVRDSGTYLLDSDGSQSLLCNLSIKVNHVLRSNDKTYLDLTLSLGTDSARTICEEFQLRKWAASRIKNMCHQFSTPVSITDGETVIDIAILSSRPAVVFCPDRVGWCKDSRRLVLPRWSIGLGGGVFATDKRLMDMCSPGQTLTDCESGYAGLRRLADRPLLASAVAAVASCILAPAAGSEVVQFTMPAGDFAVCRLLVDLGCLDPKPYSDCQPPLWPRARRCHDGIELTSTGLSMISEVQSRQVISDTPYQCSPTEELELQLVDIATSALLAYLVSIMTRHLETSGGCSFFQDCLWWIDPKKEGKENVQVR